ncbi:hypothetical protein DEJ48_38340 [Streptomyces venezuelae]|uniref:Secreted protein n=1 Tax=Streptomyces venezuelae TaxID=54571 RepID=A0A5P2C769_STRVZ|nr:hypothetical protein [Streptomyces venezuelae]QES38502.1 hypothetical protein DEJ48_38340 [Streptomyces venezuelae]
MRNTRTLRNSAIAVIATAGISLGAASGAMAATPDHATPSSVSAESAAYAKAKPKPTPKPKIVKLRDGSTAKVYKLGKNKAKAVILGPKGGTLIANGKSATANHNGLHIKLTPGGSLTSWMEKSGAAAPDSQPTADEDVTPDSAA